MLEWNPNPETNIAGYRVYYGTASRDYATTVDVGNIITFESPDLATGMVYYFAVTAYNTHNLESDYSDEVMIDLILPSPPTGCRGKIQ